MCDCDDRGLPTTPLPPSPGKALAEGARLSEVLAEREPVLGHSSFGTAIVGCSCLSMRDYRAAGHKAGQAGWRAHLAAELESVVAARVAEAERRVLREAADDMCQCAADWLTAYEQHMKDCPARWLHDRADRLAPDASPGGEG